MVFKNLYILVLKKITFIHMYLLIEIRHNTHIQCNGNYIELEKLRIIFSKLTFQEITYKNFWVSWGVISEGFVVKIMPRRPAGYDYVMG